MTDQFLSPAVCAEDLRTLADEVPFDTTTSALLEAAAQHLDTLTADRSGQA